MNNLGIGWTKFDPFDVAAVPHIRWYDKISVFVTTLGSKRVGLRHSQDEIRFAQLPVIIPSGQRRKLGSVALGRPRLNPSLNQVNLLGFEPLFIFEEAVAG